MSYTATAYSRDAVAHSALHSTPRALAVLIASYADRNGLAWPSTAELGAVLGVSYSTIWRSLRAIEAAGVLTIERQSGRVNRYRFPLANPLKVIHNPSRQREDYPSRQREDYPSRQRDRPLASPRETPRVGATRNVEERIKNAPTVCCDSCAKPLTESGRRHPACGPPLNHEQIAGLLAGQQRYPSRLERLEGIG